MNQFIFHIQELGGLIVLNVQLPQAYVESVSFSYSGAWWTRRKYSTSTGQ